MKRTAPATARNRDPILAVLRRVLPPRGLVLEIASGSGEHGLHFAAALPQLTWQPTDADPAALASIRAWRADSGPPNLLEPLPLDVCAPWPLPRADAVVCINMIHIAPWEACLGLLQGAAALLPAGGVLYLYGPYRAAGQHTAPSNAVFDEDLRARDPRYGVRDLEAVVAAAAERGLRWHETVPMPANNLSVVLRKVPAC